MKDFRIMESVRHNNDHTSWSCFTLIFPFLFQNIIKSFLPFFPYLYIPFYFFLFFFKSMASLFINCFIYINIHARTQTYILNYIKLTWSVYKIFLRLCFISWLFKYQLVCFSWRKLFCRLLYVVLWVGLSRWAFHVHFIISVVHILVKHVIEQSCS